MEANAQMRQLSFGTVDLKLHESYSPEADGDVIAYANAEMERFVVKPEFAHNNFLNAFSPTCLPAATRRATTATSGRRCWTPTPLAALGTRGFSTARRGATLSTTVLSRGDSEDPALLFRDFMGRDPEVRCADRTQLRSVRFSTRTSTTDGRLMAVLERAAVPEAQRWNAESVFASPEAWDEAFTRT